MELDPRLAYRVVKLILEGHVEDALRELSEWFGVSAPRIKIGRVRGRSRNPAVYLVKNKTIVVQDASFYNNPHVILHEFYHHLRNVGGRHRGTEGNADRFARAFIAAYLIYRDRYG